MLNIAFINIIQYKQQIFHTRYQLKVGQEAINAIAKHKRTNQSMLTYEGRGIYRQTQPGPGQSSTISGRRRCFFWPAFFEFTFLSHLFFWWAIFGWWRICCISDDIIDAEENDIQGKNNLYLLFVILIICVNIYFRGRKIIR